MSLLLPLLLSGTLGATPLPSEYIQLEVGAVRVATRRPGSDEPWTTVKEGGKGGCALLSLVPGVPAIATTLCGAVRSSGSQAHSESAPDIFVKVSAGKTALRSYIVRKSFSHRFNFRALVPAEAIPRNGLVVELLADDGREGDETKETIGSFRYSLATLLDAAKEGKTLGGADGGIEKFELMVEAREGRATKGEFQFQVAKGMQVVDGVEVLAGQVVEVSASGEYRMPGQASTVGAAGVAGIAISGRGNYPDEPFKSGRHGAALMRVGRGGSMKGALVYSCATMLAPYAGPLVVGVNRLRPDSLSGSLTFNYAVRPATVEEWQTGKVQGCLSAGAGDETWVSSATAKATEVIRNRPTMPLELLHLTHPSGRSPTITGVTPIESQGSAAVEIELSWQGGFSGTPYVTRIAWEFSRDRHIQTTAKDEGGVPFRIDPEHKRRLDAFFREEVFPLLHKALE